MAIQGHALTVGNVSEDIFERSFFRSKLLSSVILLTKVLAARQENGSPVEQ